MDYVRDFKDKVLAGGAITKSEAFLLSQAPVEVLAAAADAIRLFFCGNTFDLCTIINGKNGKCSEDCKYCAQSNFYETGIDAYDFLKREEIINDALEKRGKGVYRYSVVTSGKQLGGDDLEDLCKIYEGISTVSDVYLCSSNGLLDLDDLKALKASGVKRYHNNLETSERFFKNICTTHTYADKIRTIKAAQKAGLAICSGGILGLGETMMDRIEMTFTLVELGIHSIPVNILNPIEGTPFEHRKPLGAEAIKRSVAVMRFIAPKAVIRLAGGRELLEDKGFSLFLSGANGAITGDMLTTQGLTIKDDLLMIESLGYAVMDHE